VIQKAVARFFRVCSLDDVWEGEMAVFDAGGREVLVVHAEGGTVVAFEPECPHQNFPLVDGSLEGRTLTCAAHLWQFDASTGAGINPGGCMLKTYPVKIEDDGVFVAI
jgi:toluene monooxygenase system ferredoxin subunit